MIEDLHLRSKQSVSHAICSHDILFRLKPVGVNINIWDYCTCRMEYVQVYSICRMEYVQVYSICRMEYVQVYSICRMEYVQVYSILFNVVLCSNRFDGFL